MKRAILVEIISVLFIILFLYTGINKMMDNIVFREQIATSPLLTPIAPWIAIFLPKSEIIIAISLFIPRFRLKGLYASFVLMVLFLLYVLYIFAFNERLPCSCGGVLQQLSWKGHIMFNSFFIVLAIIGIKMERRIKREAKMKLNLSHSII